MRYQDKQQTALLPQLYIAISILLLVISGLSLFCADIIAAYFPYAEEWKILLPSLPQFAEPIEWLHGFAQTMNDPYPAWAVNSINFLRPVMNATYWLRGMLFGDNWGAQLYINFLNLGIAAAALYLSLRLLRDNNTAETQSTNLGLALLLTLAFMLSPAMISQASRFMPMILPQMAFDRLLAGLCLLSILSYSYRRYLLATLFVTAALLTKEQAIPIAIALPMAFAWSQRKQWRSAWPNLLLLAIPLIVWLASRLLLFGSVSQDVYVLMRGPLDILHSLIGNLLKLPLYPTSLFAPLKQPFSLASLLVICNGLLLAYIALDTLARWRQNGPELLSVAFLGCWGFLALVGLNPRYGALLMALTILMVARPAASNLPPLLRRIALMALLIGCSIHGWWSYQSYPIHKAFSQTIYSVGQDFAQALSDTKAATIIVLNDPNTMYTATGDLAAVLNLPVTNVHKVSDFPWPWPANDATELPVLNCQVDSHWINAKQLEFRQSCGLIIMGARVPNEQPLRLPVIPGVMAEFPDAKFNPATGYTDMGTRLLLQVDRPDTTLLFFDPSDLSFKTLNPTTGALSGS